MHQDVLPRSTVGYPQQQRETVKRLDMGMQDIPIKASVQRKDVKVLTNSLLRHYFKPIHCLVKRHYGAITTGTNTSLQY